MLSEKTVRRGGTQFEQAGICSRHFKNIAQKRGLLKT
jgi:hypothetical protein